MEKSKEDKGLSNLDTMQRLKHEDELKMALYGTWKQLIAQIIS